MPVVRRNLSQLEIVEISRFMEEHALTPDKKGYREGWDDEAVSKAISPKLKEPINFQHVSRMRISVYGFNVASRHKSTWDADVLKVLAEVPIMNAAVNMNESMAAFRIAYNNWARALRAVCTPKE